MRTHRWLLPVSWLYRLGVETRNLLFDRGVLRSRSFDLPVVSVGNLTVGGTGKTPHVEYLIRLLGDHCRVAVLSRGYKRRTHGFVLAGVGSTADDIGDEPMQIKTKFGDIHVAVDADRCEGIERLIAARKRTNVIGYGSSSKEMLDKDNMLQYLSPADLKKFGLIPEIVGRLPVITHLNPLDKDALKRILTEPKNALVKQFQKLFAMDKIKLVIKDEVLDFVVDKAIEFKVGARGLRSILEAILNDAMFEMPSDINATELVIDRGYAEAKLEKSGMQKLHVGD